MVVTTLTAMPSNWLKIAPIEQLKGSARHHITLRHTDTQEYHSLLIFSFPSVNSSESKAYYCIEATCPHLGAPLENATIQASEVELEDDIEDFVVVCPWHEYDFSLSTGESSHGINACVYACDVRQDQLWIEAPSSSEATHARQACWDLIQVRPVSEAFAQVAARQDAAKLLHTQAENMSLADPTDSKETQQIQTLSTLSSSSAIAPPNPSPKTIVEWAVLVLNTPEPAKKVTYTRYAAKAFRTGKCKLIGGGRWIDNHNQSGNRVWKTAENETPPERPPRSKDEICVQPGAEGKRGRGGTEKSRIAMLHSLANIELTAIDLAWDIVARAPRLYVEFLSPDGATKAAKMPIQFFSDFIKVAEDEAKHYTLLEKRLHELGSYFGSLPVHHGLWDSARDTCHSLTARLSIIHLVHEARGLNVNPTTIKKFENASDAPSVETLTTIHLDEITHVSAGHRWLTYLCSQAKPEPLDPIKVFREEVRWNFIGRLKGPFNAEDRKKAGLDKVWYEDLVGELRSNRPDVVGVQRAEVPGG